MTFAWRPVGADDWTVLGTDDNAPYRVFHDVTGHRQGHAGRVPRDPARPRRQPVGGAATYATVGDPPAAGGDGGGGGPVEQPDAVSVPGSLNSEMGCPGDWQPECDQAQLDPAIAKDDDLEGHVRPAGRRLRVKVAINRSWDENYGAGGVRDGANIPFTTRGGAGDVLLRPRRRTGSRTTC